MFKKVIRTARNYLGILVFDLARYETSLRDVRNNDAWLRICNRTEVLSVSPDVPGVKCNWRWSSQLHAIDYVPAWGQRLMKKALTRHRIDIKPTELHGAHGHRPDVSFIIGHRGRDRVPLLLATLNSISNQAGASFECIVVEESFQKVIESSLPAWVRYRHINTELEDQPYNRSRTFNAGARIAEGRLLVFHDNDLLVPVNYGAELIKHLEAGYQVINLKRFIFYLTRSHTRCILECDHISLEPLEFILQNLTGGGSLAVEKSAFFSIGGFDEGFVGWGGEDVEFWDRAQVLKVNNFGYLPLIHLWHPPQPEKNANKDSAAMRRLTEVIDIDVTKRIATLRERNFGEGLPAPLEVSRH